MNTTIQDLLHQVQEEVLPADDHLEPVVPTNPLPDCRLWPADLAALLDNPRAVKLEIEGFPGTCPNCNGAGVMVIFIWTRGPFQSPTGGKVKWLSGDGIAPGWYQGEAYYSNCPYCRGETWREYLRDMSGLRKEEWDITLEKFMAGGPYWEKEAARNVAGSLLAMNGNPSGFVTFWGGPGRGKSHLLMALVNGFRGIHVYSRYSEITTIDKEIKEHFSDNRGGVAAEAVIEHYQKIRVLCIDEVYGKQQETEWSKQTLFRLLDSRYRDRDRLLTVLAMEPDPDTLPEDFGYLSSRISGGVCVEVGGGDMRPAEGLRRTRKAGEFNGL
jgi:hypothetical protein